MGPLFKLKIRHRYHTAGRGHCRNGQVSQVGFPRRNVLRSKSACGQFIWERRHDHYLRKEECGNGVEQRENLAEMLS